MPVTPAALLEGFSLEMTAKDTDGLPEAADLLPPGSRMNVTFLGNENLAMRLDAAREVKRRGLVPVAHISARRLPSQAALEEFLNGLRAQNTMQDVFAVGGDPRSPEGPYADSLTLIESGLLQGYGARHISIAGYPEGHPDIPDDALWSALERKSAALLRGETSGSIITQFVFDADAVFSWIEDVRARGITLPIRVGVPGPAGIKRLLGFARRFGVGANAMIVKKYGFSLTNLLGTAGPEHLIRALAAAYEPARHGDIKLHFYTFGGVPATAEWIANFIEAERREP